MAIDLNKKLNLRKDIIIDLVKNTSIATQKARVILAMDISGSMMSLYQDGTVQNVIERIVPLAMQFDDDQEMELFLFHDGSMKAGAVTLKNLENFVQNKIMGHYDFGGTNYAPVIQDIRKAHGQMGVNLAAFGVNGNAPAAPAASSGGFFGGLFGKKAAPAPAPDPTTQAAKPAPVAAPLPTYVVFITDGDNGDHGATERVIREASTEGIFFQTVGIGRAGFGFLDKLDNLSGRVIDNANFFKATDINNMDDKALYASLLKEYPTWVNEARGKGIIA